MICACKDDSVHRLDAFDLRLLVALQENGRLTNQEVAERIGLSASQCSRRRAALETAGVISGYRAEVDPAALGFHLVVFIQVTLASHSGDNAARFRKLVADLDEVQAAYALTGDTDYLLKVVLADLRSLSALVNDVLLPQPFVTRVRSSIVLQRLKETARLPVRAASA
jgi:DNA-binding Lrp family transcriptional regulator